MNTLPKQELSEHLQSAFRRRTEREVLMPPMNQQSIVTEEKTSSGTRREGEKEEKEVQPVLCAASQEATRGRLFKGTESGK